MPSDLTRTVQELLVVASLGAIVVDYVRHLLIKTDTGIPLGLIMSHLEFSYPSYFMTRKVLSDGRGFPNRRQAIPLILLLLASGFIALLVGLSAALLLVPQYRSDWPAGGVDYHLAGGNDSLWPDILTINHTGTNCGDPKSYINTPLPSQANCIWSGYIVRKTLCLPRSSLAEYTNSSCPQAMSYRTRNTSKILPFPMAFNKDSW